MKSEEVKQLDEVQVDSPVTDPGTNPASNPSQVSVEDMKEMISASVNAAVEAALKAYKSEEGRQKAEEYNQKIAESVNKSQATITGKFTGEPINQLRYVERVLMQDELERKKHPQGKALYGDKGEDFTKAKIIILKKMGLTNEQIAKELSDII